MVNNTRTGNIFLYGAILYIGNMFIRISEMFNSINKSIFQELFFVVYNKTLLFPALNSFYKWYQNKVIYICTTREENHFYWWWMKWFAWIQHQIWNIYLDEYWPKQNSWLFCCQCYYYQEIQVEWKRKGYKLCLRNIQI